MIKRGSKVRVVKMDTAGGMDWQAKQWTGRRNGSKEKSSPCAS